MFLSVICSSQELFKIAQIDLTVSRIDTLYELHIMKAPGIEDNDILEFIFAIYCLQFPKDSVLLKVEQVYLSGMTTNKRNDKPTQKL